MEKWNLMPLPQHADPTGWLVPAEFTDLPFTPVRAYWLRGNPDCTRGAHAHVVEEEVFVCVAGRVTARVHDGKMWSEILLDSPEKALYCGTFCWHEFTQFSENAVLLALSSVPYTPGEANYITDFAAFYRVQRPIQRCHIGRIGISIPGANVIR